MYTKFYKIGLWVILGLIILFFVTHGFRYTLPDETYILYASHRFLNGQIPYRDFQMVYTPGAIFLATSAFKIFGESVLSARLFFGLLALLSSLAFYHLAFLLTARRFWSFMGTLIFLFLGVAQINFLLPRELVIFSGTFVCLLFLLFLNKRKHLFLTAAGIFSFFTFLLKQNFLVAILIVALAFFIFGVRNNRRKAVMFYLFGFVASSFLFLVYLLLTNSFSAFVDNMVFFTFQKVLLEKLGDTPFIDFSGGIRVLPRALIYSFPVIASLFALLLSYFRNRRLIFLPVFSLVYYFISLRPVSDWVHLAPVLSLVGLPLLLMLQDKNQIVKRIAGVLILAVAVLGLVVWATFGYYRWGDPVAGNNVFIANQRIMVFGDQKSFREVPDLTRFIHAAKVRNNEMFVNSFAPWLYFFSGIENITRFDYVTPDSLNLEMQNEIIDTLLQKKVQLVFSAEDRSWGDPKVQNFIEENYTPIGKISDLIAWQINKKNDN